MPPVGPTLFPVTPDVTRGVTSILVATTGGGIAPIAGSARQGNDFLLTARTFRAGTNMAITLDGGAIVLHSRGPILDAMAGTYTMPVLTVDAQGRVLGIRQGSLPQVAVVGAGGVSVTRTGGTFIVGLTQPIPAPTTFVGFGGVRVQSSGNTFFVSLASIVGAPTFVPFTLQGTNGITVTDSVGTVTVGLTEAVSITGTGMASVSATGSSFIIDVPPPQIDPGLGIAVEGDNGSYTISLAASFTPISVIGSGAIGVTQVGNTFTVNPLISHFVGLDGIAVSEQSGTLFFQNLIGSGGSFQPMAIAAGSGIAVTQDVISGLTVISALPVELPTIAPTPVLVAGDGITTTESNGTVTIGVDFANIPMSVFVAGSRMEITEAGGTYTFAASFPPFPTIVGEEGVNVTETDGTIHVGLASPAVPLNPVIAGQAPIRVEENAGTLVISIDPLASPTSPTPIIAAGAGIDVMVNGGTYTVTALSAVPLPNVSVHEFYVTIVGENEQASAEIRMIPEAGNDLPTFFFTPPDGPTISVNVENVSTTINGLIHEVTARIVNVIAWSELGEQEAVPFRRELNGGVTFLNASGLQSGWPHVALFVERRWVPMVR